MYEPSLGVAGRAAYAIEQLESWLADEERFADPAFYGSARAAIRYQPKGVVGNIVPWNFPFDLSVGPLVEMLAAGNRVIIKMSEYAPACAQTVFEIIDRTAQMPATMPTNRNSEAPARTRTLCAAGNQSGNPDATAMAP